MELKKIVETIRDAYSGPAAKEDVAAVIRHHRIQASPGYRAAAEYVLAELDKAGLECAIERYPATYQDRFWTSNSFQEWIAHSGTLRLVEPAEESTNLADFRELKLSLIQRSHSFQGEAEVVILEDGLEEADYEGVDVSGKIVLTRGAVEQVRQLAVDRFGASGIIFDGMRKAPPVREPMDLPDARQYTSFWWSGGQKACFGFVLSPRQGVWLRDLIRRQEKAGSGPVRVRADVEARFYDGEMEVVTALIPGHSEEAVIIVSHLCHPQPSANDNASGVAANLEAARTLGRLIAAGELHRPKRGIRFLWMPEMSGSYAYLSRHEEALPHLIAGLNLDMVGEDQSQTGSVLMLERPPDAAASFAPDLLERLREMIFPTLMAHDGPGRLSLFRHGTTPFSGGSDHYIFSDPTVGVPMPMLIQWPDKFYHTSADTLDKVSADSLARAGSLAAAYAFFVACAGEAETTWLAYEMGSRFRIELARLTQDCLAESLGAAKSVAGENLARHEGQIRYRLDRHQAALESLGRLWPGAEPLAKAGHAEATSYVEGELDRVRGLLPEVPKRAGAQTVEGDAWERRAAEMRPLRLYRGPFAGIGGATKLSPAEHAAWGAMLNRRQGAYTRYTLAEYWADGQRSALEIVDLVEGETGIRDAELVVARFELLQKLGLVSNETGPV